MTTISGNNYTYVGTDLVNALGYLITRTPTADSSDTLPTASDLILSFVGTNDAANNGQSFGVSIFNSSSFTITLDPEILNYIQQGSKLVGTGAVGTSYQGASVSISDDGNTLAVGAVQDDGGIGAIWIFTRTSGVWSQQGSKLIGTGAIGNANQGSSISLSSDGNTLAFGAIQDNSLVGAAWVFTRSAGVWTQQGSKLVGTGGSGTQRQGWGISLSSDGDTLALGGRNDNSNVGATWIFTRTAGVWSQQGSKLVGTGATGTANQGDNLALSSDGNTVAIGGDLDDGGIGATWIFTRSAGVWSQQGSKLVGTGNVGGSSQGNGISLSDDGNTLAVGGFNDDGQIGATWIFTRSAGVWTQQGSKLIGTGAIGNALQGYSVSLNSNGNTLAISGHGDDSGIGASWIFTRTAGVWTQKGSKLVGTGNTGASSQGYSLSLSADSTTLAMGGFADDTNIGATWVFEAVTDITFTGISSDTILPQATRTYTFVQTAVSTLTCYIIGGAPTAPTTNSGITLTNGNILVGNANNIATVTTNLPTDTIAKIGSTQTMWPDSTTANLGASTTTGTTTVNIASSSNSNIQTSTMTTWTAAAPDATKSWTSVCYGSGTFVAVSNSAGAAAGLVRTSTDGITWTSRTASSINTWSAVCFAPDINRFCAVSSNGAANTTSMFSVDGGVTWTQTTTMAAGTYTAICRGTNVPETLGNVFVAVNNSGVTTTTQLYTTTDGVTWTARTVPTAANSGWTSCCYSPDVKLYVVVGSAGTGTTQIITSSDGVTWANRTSPGSVARQWRSVCWSSELQLFAAVASDGTVGQQIMTSPDGITWSSATSPSVQQWQSVCWSSNYRIFVAVANNGTTAQQIMYSSIGTGTWTAATSTSAISWSSIVFSDSVLNRFVAVAASAVAGNGMYTLAPSGYNNTLTMGSTGTSNISFNASNLIVYPIPYYYGEITVARTVTAGVPLTDITIYNVPNGRYLVKIWMLNLLKTGAATTDFIIMTGSVQGTIYSFTTTPSFSLVGSASAAGASTGSKFLQFVIYSNSSTGIQNISYQYQSTGTAAIFTVGTLRTMVLERIG